MQDQPATLRTAERGPETRPTYLYHVTHGAVHYYLTNYDVDIVTTGAIAQTWTSGQVGHQMGEGSADISSRTATVALGILDSQFRRYFLTAPTTRATVEIYRLNSGVLTGNIAFADCYMEFSGVALGPSFNDEAIGIQFASELAQEDRSILRFNYQSQCNHVLYGHGCHVDKSLHAITKTVSVANRANRYIDVPVTVVPDSAGSVSPGVAVTAKSFEGGFLTDEEGNQVGIVSSTLLGGGLVRLFLQWWPLELAAAQSVVIYKGCQHTKADCIAPFDNLNGQFGAITGLTQTGAHIVGAVPAAWRAFAGRTVDCSPLYNDVAVAYNASDAAATWRYNVAVDFGAGPVNLGVGVIVFLNRTLGGGDTAKMPRIGGFGGHPFIPVENPAVDGTQS